ncbi:hypothetical protein AK830_g9498 [Neonectria ditissima]|uniref:Uncharacterized protein n=1 Tax=Neonectria ditissima TaxID=78410 RepID=A0A0P7B9C8_9HYPO|nr:hypothetical protein AK830_g9498 [Neonectria ditissima]
MPYEQCAGSNEVDSGPQKTTEQSVGIRRWVRGSHQGNKAAAACHLDDASRATCGGRRPKTTGSSQQPDCKGLQGSALFQPYESTRVGCISSPGDGPGPRHLPLGRPLTNLPFGFPLRLQPRLSSLPGAPARQTCPGSSQPAADLQAPGSLPGGGAGVAWASAPSTPMAALAVSQRWGTETRLAPVPTHDPISARGSRIPRVGDAVTPLGPASSSQTPSTGLAGCCCSPRASPPPKSWSARRRDPGTACLIVTVVRRRVLCALCHGCLTDGAGSRP